MIVVSLFILEKKISANKTKFKKLKIIGRCCLQPVLFFLCLLGK